MKRTKTIVIGGILAASVAAITLLVGSQIVVPQTADGQFVAGRNVNMVSGLTLPWGDPWLQRQNEPSVSVSTRNPLHLVAGANDYRTIDVPDPIPNVPGLPIQAAAARDAWIGLFKSLDGGQSWITTLLPGYPQDVSPDGAASPIHGFDTACDPSVRAGANGLFFLSGIAFDRSGGAGAVFVSRFIDNNNLEKVRRDEYLRPIKDPIGYVDTRIVATGNPGLFLDMPSLAVDVPRTATLTEMVDGQLVPAANVYLAYTVFPGLIDKNARSMVYLARSTNCGRTWGAPIKVSESQQLIQRAVVAVAPNDPTGNTVYLAFRRFRFETLPDAIVVVKSVDGGKKFSKPAVVAALPYPFDQAMDENRFRTNTYPTMAVDENGVVSVAWAERRTRDGLPSAAGQARIVVASSPDGFTWTDPAPVDLADESGLLDGHQAMPSLTYAGGKLMLAWYDQRGTLAKTADASGCVTEFIEDEPGAYRQTLDVRAAEGRPGWPPVFFPSRQVSRYLFHLVLGSNGEPLLDEDGYYALVQAEDNPVNFPLFQLGTRPFIGDYIDLAPSPQFLPPPLTGGSLWKPNLDGFLHPTSFHAVWADNRDVRPPLPDWWGDWVTYAPPDSDQPAPDLASNHACLDDGSTAGKRNQNVYTASLSEGVQVGSPGNTKQLDIPGGTAGGRRTFSVFVRNMTESGPRTFTFAFGAVAGAAPASFKQNGGQATRSVTVGPFSSASVTVYVDKEEFAPLAPVKVDVLEGGALVGYALLNPDPTNLKVVDPDVLDAYLGPEDHTPRVSDPKVWTYDLGSDKDPHPGAENPRVQNPRVQNSGLVNPRVQNPAQENPRVQNKSTTNENIVNSETGNPRVQNPRVQNTALTDMTWTVTNEGNTTSSYGFDVVADDWETLAPYFENGTLYGQVLVYKVHTTPIDSGCALKDEHHDELVVNVSNPRVQNPRVQNPAPTATALLAADGESDDEPDLTERDAAFWLAPDEQAHVIFRVYDPDILDGVSFEPLRVAAEVAAQAVNTGETAPVIVTQPHVPWVTPLPTIVSSVRALSFDASGARTFDLALTGLGAGESYAYGVSVDAPWLSVPAAGAALDGTPLTHTVSVDLGAVAPGSYAGAISVTVPEAENNPLRIPVYLTAYVAGPEIRVQRTDGGVALDIPDGGTLDFGDLAVGSVLEAVVSIDNPGGAILFLGGRPIVSLESSGPVEMTLVGQPLATVEPGGSTAFTVRFAPTAPGLQSASFSIVNSDLDENPYDVTLQGRGVEGPLEMNTPRSLHAAALLPDGRAAVFGGSSSADGVPVTAQSAEIFDPAALTFTDSPYLMTAARAGASVVTLDDGRVLLVGGNADAATSAEVFDPGTSQFEATGALTVGRSRAAAVKLADGRVLVCGGWDALESRSLASAEVFDPATLNWTLVGYLKYARSAHTATLLPDGQVLVCGGIYQPGVYLGSAEIFDPASGEFSLLETGLFNGPRAQHTATLLPLGAVIVCGGRNEDGYLTSTEVYFPDEARFYSGNPMPSARVGHTATLLPDGRVLLCGGYYFISLMTGDIEIYYDVVTRFDPATFAFTALTPMSTGRRDHAAVLLPDGKLLICGGTNAGGILKSAEVYDPGP